LSTSQIIGFAPILITALIVDAKLISGTITSSFFLIPQAFKAIIKAAVPFEHVTQYFDFKYLFINFSNLTIYFPREDIHSDFMQSKKYFFSIFFIEGFAIGILII
jgi:hypothetical protein